MKVPKFAPAGDWGTICRYRKQGAKYCNLFSKQALENYREDLSGGRKRVRQTAVDYLTNLYYSIYDSKWAVLLLRVWAESRREALLVWTADWAFGRSQALTNNMAIRILGWFKGLFAPERDNSPGTVIGHFKLGHNVFCLKRLEVSIC